MSNEMWAETPEPELEGPSIPLEIVLAVLEGGLELVYQDEIKEAGGMKVEGAFSPATVDQLAAGLKEFSGLEPSPRRFPPQELPLDARAWADAFLALIASDPKVTEDRAALCLWFAAAINRGWIERGRGCWEPV